MNVTNEVFNIVPDKSLYPKLGQTGYSVSDAIAELVDNSIDARRHDGTAVQVDIVIDKAAKTVSVSDDGIGMNKLTTAESIILGKSNKKSEDMIGRFGLGMKTAAASLGSHYLIRTTQSNSDEEYEIDFDEEKFMKKTKWDLNVATRKDINRGKSGTSVSITNLRVSIYPTLIDVVKKQLAERFAPFMINKQAIIRVNKEILRAEEPKIVKDSKVEIVINLSNGCVIKGWTGLLEVGSQTKSGFNLFNRGRLIRAHEKLGYAYHPSKMSVIGEVHLDCIPVTHNKREFITTDDVYQEFFEKFVKLIEPILLAAQKRRREHEIKDIAKEIKETIKDGILKAINMIDDFEELAFPGQDKKSIRRSDSGGEVLPKEKREKTNSIAQIEEHQETNAKVTRGRKPNKVQKKKVRFINIAGKRYQFDYEWDELEEQIPKVSFLDREKNRIMVILNSNYKILNASEVIGNKNFYVALYVTEGIVEVFVKENNRPNRDILALRDKTIEKLSEVMTDDIDEQIQQKDTAVQKAHKAFLSSDKIIDKLNDREKAVLRHRLGIGTKQLTLQAMGDQLNLTRERVRQIYDKALEKIA